jgi:hypothetical protein
MASTTIKTSIVMSTYIERGAGGVVDVSKTLAKFATDLSQFLAATETEGDVFESAVTAIFDKNKGARMNVPALTSAVLSHLNVSYENFKIMDEKFKTWLRANASTKREDGKPYSVAKGKNGGVFRWSDAPLSDKEKAAAKALADAAAKEAAGKPIDIVTTATAADPMIAALEAALAAEASADDDSAEDESSDDSDGFEDDSDGFEDDSEESDDSDLAE